MKITIVGNGVFGNAMLHVLEKNSPSVRIARREEKISDSDVVVLCVPAQSIRDVLPLISFPHDHGIIVNTAKGIEHTSHMFPYQMVDEAFGKSVEYYSLMGPSFAVEIMKDMPTLVNIGHYAGAPQREKVQKLFHTDFFHGRLSEGVEVLEISSAIKNIYAIGCGVADGLDYGQNTKAKLLTLAIEEIHKLFHGLKFNIDAQSTAGTTGDLILTCSTAESRNFRFGKYLVHYPASEALTKVSSTVEGYNSIRSIALLQQKANVELPLATFITQIVKSETRDIREQFESFMKHH